MMECNGHGDAVYITGSDKLAKEISILKELNHSNIVHIVAVSRKNYSDIQ